MSKTTNEMLADISKEIGVDEDKLSHLAKLAIAQDHEERGIRLLEEKLKEAKASLQKIKTETIPDFMDEIGIESFTTSGGMTIKVEPFYQCSIPKARKDEAFRWLSENDYEDLIKVAISLSFGKSEYEIAVEVARKLDAMGYPCVPVLQVHPMTLKGWVRMMSEEGNEFPMDLFGAYIGRTTKIK